MLHADGPSWQEQRRFALHVLRDFGVGRNQMEQKILYETKAKVEQLTRAIELAEGGCLEVDIRQIFELLIGSVLNKLLAGYGFDDVSNVLISV